MERLIFLLIFFFFKGRKKAPFSASHLVDFTKVKVFIDVLWWSLEVQAKYAHDPKILFIPLNESYLDLRLEFTLL